MASPAAAAQPLGVLDDIMPDIDLCMIVCLECKNKDQAAAAEKLQRAFHLLIQHNPWLAGRIISTPPSEQQRPGSKAITSAGNAAGDLVDVRQAHDEAPFSGVSFLDLVKLGLPMHYLDKDILVAPRFDPSGTGTKAVTGRATFINDGCFVSLNTSHALMDATSVSSLLSAWAAFTRGDEPARLRHSPILAHQLSGSSISYLELKQDPELWHCLGLDYRPKDASSAHLAKQLSIGSTVTKLFSIDRAKLAKLKAGGAQSSDSSSSPSTNDALCALLWQTIVRARQSAPDRTDHATLMCALNVRAFLDTPLQSTDVANVVAYSVAGSSVADLSTADTPRVTADVHHCVRRHRDAAHVARVLQLAAAIPDVSALGLVYPTWLRNDVVISSLLGLPLYQDRWGDLFADDGLPKRVRFPAGMFEGIVFLYPRQRDGAVEVSITMEVAHMAALEGDAAFATAFSAV